MELFGRECRLVVGTRELRGLTKDRPAGNPGLSVSFRVERSLGSDPNTAEIQVVNLSEASRRELEMHEKVSVRLDAGLGGRAPTIFLGELRTAPSTYEAPNWYTVISSGDGDTALKARAAASFQAQVALPEIIEAIAKAMGVGIGNALTVAKKAKFSDGSNVFLESAIITGSAKDELDRVLRGTNLEWSVQDGVLQLLERNQPVRQEAVLLTKESGLVRSPTVDRDGVISARSLMNGELVPGVIVTIRSVTGERTLRVARAVYIGDTAGNDWYVDIAGKAYPGKS